MNKDNHDIVEAIASGFRRLESKLGTFGSRSRSRSRHRRPLSRSSRRSRRRRSPRRARRHRSSSSSSCHRSSYDLWYSRSPTLSPRRGKEESRGPSLISRSRLEARSPINRKRPETRENSLLSLNCSPIPDRLDNRKLDVQVSGGPSISQSRDPIIEGTLSDVIQAEVTGDDVINLGFGHILDLLGKDPEAGNPNKDFVLHDQVVPRWRHTILNGSPREEVQGLSSKHSPPSNLLELIPPPINPEVKVNLPKQILIKDNAQTDLQALIATSLSALGANFNILLDPLTDIPNETRKFLLANSVDSAKLSTHLFHKISINRRNAIFPLLHKNVREQCDKTPPNNFLFGSDRSEKIKSAKMLEAAGKDLRPPQTSNFPKPKVSSYRISDKKKGGDKIDGGRSTTQNQGNSSRPSRQPRQSATHKGRRSSNSRKNWSTHQKKYYH
ncbi:hypothetical protein GE061_019927 [Apolygus lucorum]|uniref:Uncharacterized protein n=1 Tax=Apolygus lucorum TaxID=248454 RepID=A0A8S9XB40_APOLU|nr:hypothetical protein GE061_019927 [Apolygus lucorum]